MPQYSYVLQKDLHFTDLHFIAKEGDILVYTPPEQLVVYRSGEIAIQMGISKASIDGFCIAGIVRRYQPESPAPPVEAPSTFSVEAEVPPSAPGEPVVITDPDPAPVEPPTSEGEPVVQIEECPAPVEDVTAPASEEVAAEPVSAEETVADLQTYVDEPSPETPVQEENVPAVKPKRGGRKKVTEDVKQG